MKMSHVFGTLVDRTFRSENEDFLLGLNSRKYQINLQDQILNETIQMKVSRSFRSCNIILC